MNSSRLSLRVAELDDGGSGQACASHWKTGPSDLVFNDASCYCPLSQLPQPGSPEEDQLFHKLYAQLPAIWEALRCDSHINETVVVVPSLTLDAEELAKIEGIEYYEERLLFLLIQLCNPNTEVIYVTSQPIRERIVDYYLQLLPGISYPHARRRLHLYSVHDATREKSLTEKILERPALLQRIRLHTMRAEIAHLSVFNVTPAEKSLSVALGLPLMGADPKFLSYSTKSGARKLFRQTGVPCPDGFEDLRCEEEVAQAIVELYLKKPHLKRVVVKINEGFSGEGNAVYPLEALAAFDPTPSSRRQAIDLVLRDLPQTLRLQAKNLTYSKFMEKFAQMEGIVEEFLEGVEKASPSVQTRLTPTGEAQIISTHDQIMGGADAQVFLGCRFPADPPFLPALHEGGLKVGHYLAQAGLVERVSIDYMAVPHDPQRPVSADNPWDLYAIEINMRKGGTTHPFRTLQFLTGGHYNPQTGLFATPRQMPKYYVASDNLVSDRYRKLLPEDLLEVITYSKLQFNSTTLTGVIFHMIGAVSQYGKFGVTCIGNTPQEAQELYHKTVQVIDQESQTTRWLF